jgi:NAD(P)-dependent dehydrogenase (short-subunit alcohol dehydrogenase family)
VLLSMVAEKTGYPPEMLELDMALDADLGIDSIKRVEILSALQEQLPEAPTVKPEHLGTLHTLRQIAAFLAQTAQSPDTSIQEPSLVLRAGETSKPDPVPAPGTSNASGLERKVLRPVALDLKTNRPAVHLAAGAELWVVGDGSALAERLTEQLRALGYRPRPFSWSDPPTVAPPALLGGLLLLAPPSGARDRFLTNAFCWLKQAAPSLRQAGRHGGAAFVTVSRLDGAFGLANLDSQHHPISGGLAGMAKTAGHEWPEVACKAIDLDLVFSDADAAARVLVEELLLSGPPEVGVARDRRCTLHLEAVPLPAVNRVEHLTAQDVIVISGGARGVTAEAALALAEAFRPTLILLGRSPELSPEPDWLAELTDETEIKRTLSAHANGNAVPKVLGEQYQALLAQREVRRNLARLAAAGASPVYRSVDVRDADAVAAVLAEVRAKVGPITGLIHGAGILADRRIEDKTEEQFERVYATKVEGLRSLLSATANDDLKVLALFSSSTGRFGRTGQVDYAVANEVLNKMAQQQARLRPACRVVSVNWGPWEGGMVTPALQKVFAREGIGLIPLAAGARHLVQEISAPVEQPVEVVVLGSTPTVPSTAPALTTAFERELDLRRYPVLKSHVIDGRAVVPMALQIEWLAHAALHGHPGLQFHGFNGLRILHGVVLEHNQPHAIRVLAGKAVKQERLHVVPVELRGRRPDGRDVVHSRAEIVLATELPAAPSAHGAIDTQPYTPSLDEIYRDLLFHGPDLHGIERVEGCSVEGIVGMVRNAPAPTAWIGQPLRGAWLADPLVLDSSFQLMVLWSFAQHGAFSLPCFAGHYRQFRRNFPPGGVLVVCRVTKDSDHSAHAIIDYLDRAGNLIACLEDYECVLDAPLKEAFRRNQVPQEAMQ